MLFAGACTNVNIPTIPPINIPPIDIPSIPPINFPGFSIPPINLPSGVNNPPIAIPHGKFRARSSRRLRSPDLGLPGH